MIVPVMAISNLVLTQQIYSEETNGAHAHYREPVPLTACFHAAILIILLFTHGAPIKAKLWLEESQYRKRGANTFQKMGAEL